MNLKTASSSDLYKRILRAYVWPYRFGFLSALCFMILAAIGTSALPYLLQPVFDEVFTNGTVQSLVFFCSAVMAAFIIKAIGSYGENIIMTRIGQSIISDIQAKLFKNLMKADLAYLQSQTVGTWLAYLTQDVQSLRHALSQTIVGLGKDTMTFLGLVIVMVTRDPILALIALLIVPWVVIPVARIGRSMRRVTDRTHYEMSRLASHFVEVLGGVRVVKAYEMENHEAQYAQNHIQDILRLVVKSARVRAALHPVVEGLGGLAIITVIAYGGWQVMHHNRTTGAFLSFITALLLIYEPLKRLCNLHTHIQEGMAAAARIFSVMDEPQRVLEPTQPASVENIKGNITFDDVSFAYTDENVLSNISFTITPGQKVAFVGPSGSGKTTLLNLIARFYDAKSGSIIIDEHNVQNISHVRQYMSLVSQDIALFDRTVAENIAYGINVSQERIEKAAKEAAAHDFIMQLPEGYQTVIGEEGNTLSGGQRQRLAIARALIRDTPILLLDEATSALDATSEKHIQKALENLMEGRTTLMVAHRLTTIQNADWIYVLQDGRIVEGGSHEQLIQKQGLYAQLWLTQQNNNT